MGSTAASSGSGGVRKWKVTKQPVHNNKARCQACQATFEVGEVRLNSVRAVKHPRYWHVQCLAEPLGAGDVEEAAQELGSDVRDDLEPFATDEARPARVAADPVIRARPEDGVAAHAAPQTPAVEAPSVALEVEATAPSMAVDLPHLEWWAEQGADALAMHYSSVEGSSLTGQAPCRSCLGL